MRLSSVRAYEQIKKEELLPKMRLLVYEALGTLGPSTALEVDEFIRQSQLGGKSMGAWKRLSELKTLGVARELPEMRDCKVSGRLAMVWDIVDEALPNPEGMPKKVTPRQRVKELESENFLLKQSIATLEAQVAHFRSQGQMSLI
jgi:hypothetical protein